MKVLGIEFVPFHVPLHRRFETFWAGFWFIIFVFGSLIFSSPFVYLLFTRFWWVSLLTAGFIYLDLDAPEKGGRPFKWIQHWTCWRYMRRYYNSDLIYDFQSKLNPRRNYLFCCFPHGIIAMGPFTSTVIKAGKFHEVHSDFNVKLAVINMNFFIPILREIMLSMEMVSSSSKSLNHILGNPDGGNIVILMVGGAAEAFYTKPGKYTFIVKERKGFVKMALRNGSPLVPVITFGEDKLLQQIQSPGLRKGQEFIKKWTGIAPVVFNGRGLFQYSFGLFPRRTQLTTVVGKPIEVQKVEHPTIEEINDLHSKFVNELEQLFEKYKHMYTEDPENTHAELI